LVFVNETVGAVAKVRNDFAQLIKHHARGRIVRFVCCVGVVWLFIEKQVPTPSKQEQERNAQAPVCNSLS